MPAGTSSAMVSPLTISEFLKVEVEDALELQSTVDLPLKVRAIPGLCGKSFRRFLNLLCRGSWVKYLEVGTWKGASLFAAAYNNPGSFYGMDNFSEFGEHKGSLEAIRLNVPPRTKVNLFCCDALEIEALPAEVKGVNVFYYDGDHSAEATKNCLIRFLPIMAESFIYLVDDWNWGRVRQGVEAALSELSELKVEYYKGISSPTELESAELRDDLLLISETCDVEGFWNGLGIFVLRKEESNGDRISGDNAERVGAAGS